MDVSKLKLMTWPVRLPFNMFTGMLMINHPPVEGAYETDFGDKQHVRDMNHMKDLCQWYNNYLKSYKVDSEIWAGIVKNHLHLIDMLETDDYEGLFDYLASMFKHPITYGLAQGDVYYRRLVDESDFRVNMAFAIYDKFISLMESSGLIPMFSPEAYEKNPQWFLKYYTIDPDKYMQLLETHYGAELKAPLYQGGLFGIRTQGHGLYSDRDIMSLGVAIKIAERYSDKKDISICDLGGGVGHLAFYLTKLGFKSVTTVDIPTVTVASAFFLDTNLPGNMIAKITPPMFDGKYDLVVNVDGLTGYGVKQAREYTKIISSNARHFYSINKESDELRVCDITDMKRVTRNAFMLRRGYIEEDYIP
jgi:hypothetical protein